MILVCFVLLDIVIYFGYKITKNKSNYKIIIAKNCFCKFGVWICCCGWLFSRFYITNLLLRVFVLVAGEDDRVPNDSCKISISNCQLWSVKKIFLLFYWFFCLLWEFGDSAKGGWYILFFDEPRFLSRFARTIWRWADTFMLFRMPVGRDSVGGVGCIQGWSVGGSSSACLRCG